MSRAIRCNFNIIEQFKDRIRAYVHTGNIDISSTHGKKIEIISTENGIVEFMTKKGEQYEVAAK